MVDFIAGGIVSGITRSSSINPVGAVPPETQVQIDNTNEEDANRERANQVRNGVSDAEAINSVENSARPTALEQVEAENTPTRRFSPGNENSVPNDLVTERSVESENDIGAFGRTFSQLTTDERVNVENSVLNEFGARAPFPRSPAIGDFNAPQNVLEQEAAELINEAFASNAPEITAEEIAQTRTPIDTSETGGAQTISLTDIAIENDAIRAVRDNEIIQTESDRLTQDEVQEEAQIEVDEEIINDQVQTQIEGEGEVANDRLQTLRDEQARIEQEIADLEAQTLPPVTETQIDNQAQTATELQSDQIQADQIQQTNADPPEAIIAVQGAPEPLPTESTPAPAIEAVDRVPPAPTLVDEADFEAVDELVSDDDPLLPIETIPDDPFLSLTAAETYEETQAQAERLAAQTRLETASVEERLDLLRDRIAIDQAQRSGSAIPASDPVLDNQIELSAELQQGAQPSNQETTLRESSAVVDGNLDESRFRVLGAIIDRSA